MEQLEEIRNIDISTLETFLFKANKPKYNRHMLFCWWPTRARHHQASSYKTYYEKSVTSPVMRIPEKDLISLSLQIK